MKIRIECTGERQRTARYIVKDGSNVRCFLSDGTSASLHYAGVKHGEETRCLFALEDATTAVEAIEALQWHAYSGWHYSAL
jgi:hypothetical protein